MLKYSAACTRVKVKEENEAAGSSSEKNTASEVKNVKKVKDASKSAEAAFTFVKTENAAFTFSKKDNDAAFAKKEKDEEAEVAYHCGAASKSGKIEEVSEEEVGAFQSGVVDAAWLSGEDEDDDVVIIDAAATPESTPPSYTGKRKWSEMTDTQKRHFRENRSKHFWQKSIHGVFGEFATQTRSGCTAKRRARAGRARARSEWEADPRNTCKAMPAHLEKQQAQPTPKGTRPLAIPKRIAELLQVSIAPKAWPPNVALPPPPPPPPPAPPAPPLPARHVSAAKSSSAAKSLSTSWPFGDWTSVANKMQAQPKKPNKMQAQPKMPKKMPPPWRVELTAAPPPWRCLFKPVKDNPVI